MKKQHAKLPIFPLPVYLLPEGITRLRIFEPRYLKMVSLASKEQGFVIYLTQNSTENTVKQTSDKVWGSWVDIINFGQGSDGILEIDVKCKSLFELHSFKQDKNKLNYANTSLLEHWATSRFNTSTKQFSTKKTSTKQLLPTRLSTSLVNVINNSDILSELYPKIPTNNTIWLIARWLEILPIEQLAKHLFIEQYSFQQAQEFVETILFK